jgi:pseudouridine kinase
MPQTAPTLCIGAAHWDLVARAAAPLSPGADVPGEVRRHPGGVAANVARFLARLGAPASLIAAVGGDDEGAALTDELARCGVDCTGILRHPGRTDAYLAIEAADGALHAAVADCRSLERHGADLVAALVAARPARAVVDGNLPAGSLALLAGPALGGTELAILAASPEKAPRLRALAGRPGTRFYGNRAEVEAFLGTRLPDGASAASALTSGGFMAALVTDGAAPAAFAAHGGGVVRTPPPAALRSVTGAGDMVAAAHLAALARGLSAGDALEAALAAAARHISGDAP